jgi:hypothetical protein
MNSKRVKHVLNAMIEHLKLLELFKSSATETAHTTNSHMPWFNKIYMYIINITTT